MRTVTDKGIAIEYDTVGDAAQPAVLLVMGLGAQLVYWPDEFCSALAGRGFFVIRYDNRDVGLSSKIEDGPNPDVMAAMTGDMSSASYTLADMAEDGMGVLDALGIDAAHVVGVSMGGMIVQQMALQFADRVRSVCSIMSSPTGVFSADPPSDEANAVLFRPPALSREQAIGDSVDASKVIGSTGFPFDEAKVRARAALSYDRCFYPPGIARQLLAVLASGDRTPALAGVKAPALVIHGAADPLIRPSWGRATAEAIPGAQLLMVDGMGHDLPEGAWPVIIDGIVANAARAG